MLIKRTAIFFLTLAYAILLGHNIIPHHHHDKHEHDEHAVEHLHADHHHSEHHHSDVTHHSADVSDSNVLHHLFAHLIHPSEEIYFLPTENISHQFSKSPLSLVALLPDNFSSDEPLVLASFDKPPEKFPLRISPHSSPSGLRAPPTSLS